MSKCKLIIVFCFVWSYIFGQNELKFNNNNDYLNFLEKKFDIEKNDVYTFEAYNDSTFLGKYSSVIFLKGTKITTIEEVRNIDNNICPPKKFFSNLLIEKIEKSFSEDKKLSSIFFKNLYDNSTLVSNDDLIAIFLFSYKLGNSGLRYYKQKHFLEKLNIKCIVLTIDEADVGELQNINNTKVVIKK